MLFGTQPFTSKLIVSNLEWFKYEWIWEKEQGTNAANCNKMPLKSHENICIFYKNLPSYNPQFTTGEKYIKTRKKPSEKSVYGRTGLKDGYTHINYGERYPSTIIKINRPYSTQRIHPTQKPVKLCEYLIKTYTNKGELVLDNCIGSGTTIIAAINTERNFIGIEKDETYFKLAQERIQRKINGGIQLDMF